MSDPIEIPIPVGVPLFTLRVTLDGQDYTLGFDWNDREGRWYCSISDGSGVLIQGAKKVLANWPLLRAAKTSAQAGRVPPGDLIPCDLGNPSGDPPGFAELGGRVRILYFPL